MAEHITPWVLATVVLTFSSIVIFSSNIAGELWDSVRITVFGSSNKGHTAFEAFRDTPSMAGKVVLITGAAGDLGRQTAIELARYGSPARIYVADLPRDQAAQNSIVEDIINKAHGEFIQSKNDKTTSIATEIHLLELDLTSFDSIRKCAAEFVAKEERLDILLLDAGVIRVAPGSTKEHYEVHFGLNYLGHALLTKLLMPTMLRTAKQQQDGDVRVVIVSSEGNLMASPGGIQYDKLGTDCEDLSYQQRYGQSKLALISFARELARRHSELKVVALHPGRILTVMATKLAKESSLVRWTMPIAPYFCVPVSVGIRNHLWAVGSTEVKSGTYYEPVGVPGKVFAAAEDSKFSARLWQWTQNELNSVKAL